MSGGTRLNPKIRNTLLAGCAILVATTVARAQPADPIGDLLNGARLPDAPQPYVRASQTVAQPLSSSDQALYAQGMAAAKRGDIGGAKSAISSLSDPVARKLVTWAMVDVNAERLSFWDVDAARRDLAGFPRGARRQVAAERLLETSASRPPRSSPGSAPRARRAPRAPWPWPRPTAAWAARPRPAN